MHDGVAVVAYGALGDLQSFRDDTSGRRPSEECDELEIGLVDA
jgi:hypothetical protein